MRNRLCLLLFTVLIFSGSCQAISADSLEAAKLKADKYFKQNRRHLSSPVLMVMDYVCKYYHVKPPVHSACLAKIKLHKKGAAKQAMFKRFVKPSFCLKQSVIDSLRNTTDRLTLNALYCDCHHLSADTLYQMMINLSGEGNPYHVSHALLGFYLAEQHGCITKADRDYDPVKRMLQSGAESILQTNLSSYDRRFELYAFLRLSGVIEKIPDSELAYVLLTQNKKGAWPVSLQNETSSDHTSLLAYIMLLEGLRQ